MWMDNTCTVDVCMYIPACVYVYVHVVCDALRGNFRGFKEADVLLFPLCLHLTLKHKSPTDFVLTPFHLSTCPQLLPSFRQRACNAILMMEVSFVAAAFTPRYGARVKYARE